MVKKWSKMVKSRQGGVLVYSITVRGLCVHEMVLQGETMWQVRTCRNGQNGQRVLTTVKVFDHGQGFDHGQSLGGNAIRIDEGRGGVYGGRAAARCG